MGLTVSQDDESLAAVQVIVPLPELVTFTEAAAGFFPLPCVAVNETEDCDKVRIEVEIFGPNDGSDIIVDAFGAARTFSGWKNRAEVAQIQRGTIAARRSQTQTSSRNTGLQIFSDNEHFPPVKLGPPEKLCPYLFFPPLARPRTVVACLDGHRCRGSKAKCSVTSHLATTMNKNAASQDANLHSGNSPCQSFSCFRRNFFRADGKTLRTLSVHATQQSGDASTRQSESYG